MKKFFRLLLKIVGGFMAFMLFGMIAVVVSLRIAGRKVEKAAAEFKPGMTIEQAVQHFPHGFNFGHIGESEAQPCAESAKSEKCPLARSLTVFRPEEQFNIEMSVEGEEQTVHKTLSSAEFADFLSTEFAGRAWHANFTYLNSTPRHYSLTVSVGADGKVKEPPRISWMD